VNEAPVTFSSGDLTLEGLIAIPAGADAIPAAVVCHPHPQYGGSMHNNVVEAVLEAFWRRSFATLRFNFRGVGASEGEYGGGQGEADDAIAAMRFLLSRPGIASSGAVMSGYSFGAAVAMRAGSASKEVDTIVAVALPVAMDDFSAVAKGGKRLILVAGDRDAYCSEREISELAKTSGAKLKVLEGADHFFGGYEDQLTAALDAMLTDEAPASS